MLVFFGSSRAKSAMSVHRRAPDRVGKCLPPRTLAQAPNLRGLITIAPVPNSDSARVTNEGANVSDRDASLVNEDEVCRAKIQWLDNDRSCIVRMNLHDTGIADED